MEIYSRQMQQCNEMLRTTLTSNGHQNISFSDFSIVGPSGTSLNASASEPMLVLEKLQPFLQYNQPLTLTLTERRYNITVGGNDTSQQQTLHNIPMQAIAPQKICLPEITVNKVSSIKEDTTKKNVQKPCETVFSSSSSDDSKQTSKQILKKQEHRVRPVV